MNKALQITVKNVTVAKLTVIYDIILNYAIGLH